MNHGVNLTVYLPVSIHVFELARAELCQLFLIYVRKQNQNSVAVAGKEGGCNYTGPRTTSWNSGIVSALTSA